MNESCLTFIHALSPLHAGTGQGVGVIDLPIAREKATNLPYLPGSTLKGSMRDECGDITLQEQIFGPEKPDSDSAYAGSAIFTDQRLLCLPVRSLLGTFAWVTSPFILERFKRDAENINIKNLPNITEPANEQTCLVLSEGCKLKHGQKVILEDLDLNVQDGANADDWANWLAPKIFADVTWQANFRQRFCIVSDNVMSFLAETATEVTARNVLSENKTSNNLWYEESLPSETILSGLLVAVHVKATSDEVFKTIKKLTAKPIQLGGSMTVGRGLCQVGLDYRNGQNGGANDANT
jgi:CRISPR-associated protein Cmr4